MTKEQNQQQNNDRQQKQEKPASQFETVSIIGFIGGLLWSSLGQLSHYFNFTEIGPTVVLGGWNSYAWTDGYLGIIFSILLYGVAGIVAAFIYYWLLRKQQHLSVSIIFGAILWLIVHLALAPIFPEMPTVADMDFNTIVTTVCLYILFGVFAGVSVSFDESERRRMEQLEQEQDNEVQS